MIDRAKLSYVEGDLNYMAPMAGRPRYLRRVLGASGAGTLL